MGFFQRCLSTKIVHILVLICFVIFVTLTIFVFVPEQQSVHRSKRELSSSVRDSIANSEFHIKYSKCEVVHIGVVYTGYKSNFYFYTMLKSLYFYRNNPLQLHIIVDDTSEKLLQTMFDTWDVPQVTVNFYHINSSLYDLWWMPKTQNYPEAPDILKLTFSKIIPQELTSKLIVIDPDLTFAADIYKLWNLFDDFNNEQAIGLVQDLEIRAVQSPNAPISNKRFKTGVILYNLERLKAIGWDNTWGKFVIHASAQFGEANLANQDIINAVAKDNFYLLYPISCHWYTQLGDQKGSCFNNNKIKIMQWKSSNMWDTIKKGSEYHAALYNVLTDYNGSLLRRKLYGCEDNSDPRPLTNDIVDDCTEFVSVQQRKFRTMAYLKDFKYNVTENDVTIVSQLTFDRLKIVEELSNLWEGPISVTFYVTDAELRQCMNFIETSEVLQKRTNIGYHVVFKEGVDHPINELRNVALRNVVTPYVFLNDMDFIPMKGTYSNIKKHIGQMQTMEKMALIVPAFETKGEFPITKMDLLHLLEKDIVLPILLHGYFKAHAPTNYTVWPTAEAPYKVNWEPEYEPYVIVQRNVTGYDRRFFGFGFDKVSHIMELYKQGYEFLVLPDVFTVHKDHPMSNDKVKYINSETYRNCLNNRIKSFHEELEQKYGSVPVSRRSLEMQYLPSNSTNSTM